MPAFFLLVSGFPNCPGILMRAGIARNMSIPLTGETQNIFGNFDGQIKFQKAFAGFYHNSVSGRCIYLLFHGSSKPRKE